MQNRLTVDVRTVGDTVIFDLAGDLTEGAEPDFETVLRPAVPSSGRVAINFTRVGYINSSGIALLIAFITTLQASGGTLSVYGLTPHFQKIFEIIGLTQFLRLEADEAHALGHGTP
jgi:anti-anti-sigma factor